MSIYAYKLASWTVYPNANELVREGHSKKLEARVMQLLIYFCENPNRVISQAELIQAIWGRTALSANSLSVAIAAIRQALDDDVRAPRYIETHKKLGYRLLLTPRKFEATLRPEGKGRLSLRGVAALILVVVGATWAWFNQQPDLESQLFVITLEPIENGTGLAEFDDISETLGDVLIAELAQHDRVAMRKVLPDRITRALALEVPRDARSTILSGRLIRQEEKLVLTLHLEDRATSRVLWADRATINQDHLLSDIALASNGMLQSLHIGDTDTADAVFDQSEAASLYRRAKQLASVTSDVTIKLAHSLLLEAVRIEPHYGSAHALLAEMYSWHYPTSFWGLRGDRFSLAEGRLELARQFGADEANMMVTEAGIYLARDRSYEMARDLLEQAAALRPNDPWVLRPQIWANMLLGDFEAALAYNLRAADASLDPRSVLLERIAPLYYLGRFEEALDLYKATVQLELKPLFQGPHAAIMAGDQVGGFRYWVHFIRQQGVEIEDESEPLRWIESGGITSAYDWLRQRSGEFLLDRNFALASASWHIAAGDHDMAVEEISEAIRVYRSEQEPLGNPSYSWTLFLYDPLFAEVRRDPGLAVAMELLRAGIP